MGQALGFVGISSGGSVGLLAARMSVRRVGCWRSLRCLLVPRGRGGLVADGPPDASRLGDPLQRARARQLD